MFLVNVYFYFCVFLIFKWKIRFFLMGFEIFFLFFKIIYYLRLEKIVKVFYFVKE